MISSSVVALVASYVPAAPLAVVAAVDVLNAAPGAASFVGGLVGGLVGSLPSITRRMDARADRRVRRHERDCPERSK